MNFILFLLEPTNEKLKNVGGSFFHLHLHFVKKEIFFSKNGKKHAFWGQKCHFFEKIKHLTKILPPNILTFCEEW